MVPFCYQAISHVCASLVFATREACTSYGLFIPCSSALRRPELLPPHRLLRSLPKMTSFSNLHLSSHTEKIWKQHIAGRAPTAQPLLGADGSWARRLLVAHGGRAEQTHPSEGAGDPAEQVSVLQPSEPRLLLVASPAGLWAVSKDSIRLNFLEVTTVKPNQSEPP